MFSLHFELKVAATLFAILVAQCDCAKILAFMPMPLHSHQITFRPIFRALADKGHQVTLVTSLPDSTAPYEQIVVKLSKSDLNFENFDFYNMGKDSWFSEMLGISDYAQGMIHSTFKTAEVERLVQSTDRHFDLVMVEIAMNQEVFVSLGHKFGAPVIDVEGLCPNFWTYHLIANPYSFSHTVTYYTHSSDSMNFWERLENTIIGVTQILMRRYYEMPIQEALAEKYFKYPGWETRPPLVDLLANVSLILQNTHIATHYPHPYNPNVIEFAGTQVQTPSKLPQDLQNFLDSASQGVIYFSFGSILPSHAMPEKQKQAFISTFKKLPYKVLWKWGSDTFPDKPHNVYTSKWLPQADVLAHPNVKVFITHGGLGGMTEATYHGVPFLVIPFFIDQVKNAKKIESVGSGIVLDFSNITEKSVSWALNAIFTQSSIREAAQKQSMLLKDNPIPPLEKVVYWTEYVLRHKGAPHLRTAAATLPFYKYYLIDVIAVLLLSVVLVLFSLYLAIRTTFRLVCGRSNVKEKNH